MARTVMKNTLDRKKIKTELRERYGVSLAGEVYEEPLHKQPVFASYATGPLPVSEDLCARHICLPVFSGMQTEDAEQVLDAFEMLRAVEQPSCRLGQGRRVHAVHLATLAAIATIVAIATIAVFAAIATISSIAGIAGPPPGAPSASSSDHQRFHLGR